MKRTLIELTYEADTPALTMASRSGNKHDIGCRTSSGADGPALLPLKRIRRNNSTDHHELHSTETIRVIRAPKAEFTQALKEAARTFRCHQNFSDARTAFEQLLPLEEGLDLMESLTELGKLCLELGDADSSMNYHNAALTVYFDQSTSQVVCSTLYSSLAIVNLRHVAAIYLHFSRFNDALVCYTYIYKIQQDAEDTPLQDLVSTLSFCGLMHYLMENYNTALRFYQEELRLRLRDHNGNVEHEDVAIALNSVGIVYYQLDALDQARELFQACLQIRQRLLGDEIDNTGESMRGSTKNKITNDAHWRCYDLAMVYFNLAAIAMKQGNEDQAAHQYRRSMELKKAVFGPDHPEIAVDYQYLGKLFFDHGDFETAVEYYTEAYKVVQLLESSYAQSTSSNHQQAQSAGQKLLVIIGNIQLLNADVAGMMKSFEEAASLNDRIGTADNFMEHVRVFGCQLSFVVRMHPPCAAKA